MSAPSEYLELTAEQQLKAKAICNEHRTTIAMHLVSLLEAEGIPLEACTQIAVGEMICAAARLGMLGALGIEKREPDRDLWLRRCGEDFDSARDWWSESGMGATGECCPICAEPFKPDDKCATDIELGTCHYACLDGSPVVDLDTGEELVGASLESFPYVEEQGAVE